jgi:mRNA interferase RelE/StbE
MAYFLKIKNSALKEIARIPVKQRVKVIEAIDELKNNPHHGSLLKGKFTGLRRIRVGNYRIIFEVQNKVLVVLVLRVGHRRDVYR